MAKSRRDSDDEPRKRKPSDEDERPKKKKRAQEEEDEEEEEEAEDDGEPKKKARKKRKKTSTPRLVLYCVSGLGGAVGLFFLLYWIYSPMGVDSSLLCYCPPTTVKMIGCEYEDIRSNSRMKEVGELMPNNWKNKYWRPVFVLNISNGSSTEKISHLENNGFKETEVQKYIYAVAADEPQLRLDYPLDPQRYRGYIEVFRFKNNIDKEKIMRGFNTNFLVEDFTKDGKEYKQLYVPDRRFPTVRHYSVCIYFPNARTMIYASTRRECEEVITRQEGKAEVGGAMLELTQGVDGQYFELSTVFAQRYTVDGAQTVVLPPAFSQGFLEEDISAPKPNEVVGFASWIASNSNDFLSASAVLYLDPIAAKSTYRRTSSLFDEVAMEIYRSDNGATSSRVSHPMEKPVIPGMGGGQGPSKEEQAARVAQIEFIKRSRVYRRGKMVVIEGRVTHDNFDLYWKAYNSQYALKEPQQ